MHDLGAASLLAGIGQSLAEFVRALAMVLAALPSATAAFAGAMSTILNQGHGSGLMAATVLACAVVLSAAALCQRLHPGRRLVMRWGWSPAWGPAVDGLCVALTTLAVASVAAAALPSDPSLGTRLCGGVLWGTVRFRFSLLALEMIARSRATALTDPVGLPAAFGSARPFLAGGFALGLAFVSVVPILLESGMPLLPARAVALLTSVLVAASFLAALARLRQDGALLGPGLRAGLVGLVVAGWAIWVHAVVNLDFALWDAFVSTVLVGLMVALVHSIGRDPGVAGDAAADLAVLPDALRRCASAIAAGVGLLVVLPGWFVDALSLVPTAAWPMMHRAVANAVGLSLMGYVGSEALMAWSTIRFGAPPRPSVPGLDEAAIPGGTRMGTIVPLLARFLLVISVASGLLVGLSQLGLNISPLLAGAGIFGLAISFGSQALVRDIVSGFFFIADDAFRLGEYVDVGRHKGAVERIALRSLRLRHQNGQVHTVPYGQINAVTNFSRDWVTIKFNLRMAPGTDIERVRKTAKGIGQTMLEDPEWGPEFITPLKLQGLADVVETGLVLRFKFTARPHKVTQLQREVTRRLYDALSAGGIRFATNALVLRSDDAAAPPRQDGSGQERPA